MRSSKPPALASWLLEHLVPGNQNDALAGDLLERFHQRPSAAWYWRQVLAAIFVGFARQLHSQWVAVGFAILWTGIIVILAIRAPIWSAPFISSFYRWALRLDWPLSIICLTILYLAVTAAEFLAAVGLYLALRRGFDLRQLLRGTVVGLLVLFCTNTSFGLLVWLILGDARPGFIIWYVIGYLQIFFSLLVSMWLAGSHDERSKAREISR